MSHEVTDFSENTGYSYSGIGGVDQYPQEKRKRRMRTYVFLL